MVWCTMNLSPIFRNLNKKLTCLDHLLYAQLFENEKILSLFRIKCVKEGLISGEINEIFVIYIKHFEILFN